MTIRVRILALLSLLSLICIGTSIYFERLQEKEEVVATKQREQELARRLQRLVNATARPAYRYLRNYSRRAGMVSFLTSRDQSWAEKNIRGKMDLYRIDSAWVLLPDGTVVYGFDRPTETALTAPPLPLHELEPVLRKNGQFEFHAFFGDRLYHVQGMPIVATADLERRAPPLGWLVVAKHWGESVLEDMADSGQGRVFLTGTSHVNDTRGLHELEAWQPLMDQTGSKIAGLDYHVNDPQMEDPALEHLELALFVLNSFGAVVLVGVLMHFWILRPFSLVRTSLVTRDPAPLASLLGQANEFGQMARIVQASMHDREQLRQNLEERMHLGRELHDGAIQGVYGAGMALSRVQSLIGRDLPAAHQLLDETRAELNRVIHDLRRQIDKVDPRPLDATFAEAVARLIQQLHGAGPITTDLNIEEDLVASHSPLHRGQALQFVREAISNALRHGHPNRLAVSWRRTPDGSVIEVADDGLGFDPAALKPGGRGIGNLAERAVALGGRLEIDSSLNQGTRILLALPPTKASP